MKKQKYSLTAKERKELRGKGEQTDAEEQEEVAEAEQTSKFNFWIIPLMVAAVALIVTAIILPFTCSPYGNTNNPIAKMELSNGMVLEFELYEDTCPTAATNFIWLARNNFFEDTVIYDNQQNWVRFGDFKTADASSRKSDYANNKEYLDTLTGIYSNHASNPLGYRLKKDSSPHADRYNEIGMLTFNYNMSSCRFFISAKENCQTRLEGRDYNVTVVGRYLNDATLDNIKEIAAMDNEQLAGSTRWRNPTPIITIKKVTIYNLDGEKWNNFHFENYMEDVTSYEEDGKPIHGTNNVVTGWGYSSQE